MLPAQSLTLGLRSSVLDKTSCYLVGPQLVARDVVPVQSSQGSDGTRDTQGSPLSLPICPPLLADTATPEAAAEVASAASRLRQRGSEVPKLSDVSSNKLL